MDEGTVEESVRENLSWKKDDSPSADRIDIIRADNVESDFSSGPRETSPVNPRRSVVETKPEIASQ